MKKVNKRTKISLAIVGVLLIAGIVAGVVITQMPASGLFGATGTPLLTPETATILVGNTQTLTVTVPNLTCTWRASSDPTIASYVGTPAGLTATVKGKSAGTASFIVECANFFGAGIAKVNVVDRTFSPANRTLVIGEKLSMTVNDHSCGLDSSPIDVVYPRSVSVDPNAPPGGTTFNLIAVGGPQTTLTANCPHGTATTVVKVVAPAISPANPTISRGGSVNLAVNSGCTFSTSNTNVVTLGDRPTTTIIDVKWGQVVGGLVSDVKVTGVAAGTATITADCNGATSTTVVTVK